ncbi:hypothetical protein [Ruegeria sp. HKCCC2117]|uniref:hypothetical protein n=1 Tax=Ruegeria sp. HKCCC2117 TaxID=2682992 RepID=UPI001487C734|nr:hypothetical protein [Ruegeria sp. HKCCC2117]
MPDYSPRKTVYFSKEELDLIKKVSEAQFMSAAAYIRAKLMPIVIRESKRLENADG